MRRTLVFLLCLLLCGTAHAEFIFSDGDDGGDSDSPVESGIVFSDGVAEATQAPEETGGTTILITAAGDVTIGGNMRKNPKSNMYTEIVAAQEGDLSYFFANVYDIFSQDDLTLVNFEGVLSNVTKHKDHTFTFRAPPEHVDVLTLGSVESVALENNHVKDFYEEGYQDTVAALNGAGIVYASEDDIGVFEVQGIRIAMLAYQTFDNAYPRLFEKVPKDVAAAKEQYDLVIVSYHWGVEEDYAPNANQIKLGRATIDAGADLVLGHHSHRVNPIELYNGKYIVYSLGNCSFSGNTRPRDMDTFLFQQKFVLENGVVSPGAFRIIPCSISSNSGESGAESARNDLKVTPFPEGSEGVQRVIDKLLKNSGTLEYAVTDYPTDWQ